MTVQPLQNMIPPRRLESLQIIRALAAILVIFDHAVMDMSTHTGHISALQFVGFQCGRFGVLVFFVVSGFIMVRSSYNAEGPKTTVVRFAINRIRRIVPLYWACTLVAILFFTVRVGKLPSLWQVFASMFFLPLTSDYGQEMYPLVGQGWTLYYEAFFYLIFAFGLVFSGFRGIYIGCIIITALICINIFASLLGGSSALPGIVIFYTQQLQILFPVGMLIAVAIRRKIIPDVQLKYPISICIAIFGIMIVQFYFHLNADQLPPLDEAFYYVMAALVVLVCALAKDHTYGRFGKLFVFLGEASYAIYLTHNFVVATVSKLTFSRANDWTYLWYFPFAGLAAVVVGALVHLCFEKPITSFLARIDGNNQLKPARKLASGG
jgi:peptidoglycan/LPS O-acetylase OafA/YrhL